MVDSKCRIMLDVQDDFCNVQVNVKEGDVGRKLYITLLDGGAPYIISDGAYVTLTARKPNGNVLYDERCTVTYNYEIVYEIDGVVNESRGRVPCEVKVYGEDGEVLTSATFDMIVQNAIYQDGDAVETPAGKTRVLMSPNGATVGQYLQIEEVDKEGRVKKLKPVDAPEGGGSGDCFILVSNTGSADAPVDLSGYGIKSGSTIHFKPEVYYVAPFSISGMDHVTFVLGDAEIRGVDGTFLTATSCDFLRVEGGTVSGAAGSEIGIQIQKSKNAVFQQVCFSQIGTDATADAMGLFLLGDCTGFLVDRCRFDGIKAGAVSADGYIHAYGVFVNRDGSNAYSLNGSIRHCQFNGVAGIDRDDTKADGEGVFIQRPPYFSDSGALEGVDQTVLVDGCVFLECKKRGVKSAAWGTMIKDCWFSGDYWFAAVDLQYGHGTVDRCHIVNTSNYTGTMTSGIIVSDGGVTVRESSIACPYTNDDGSSGNHPGFRFNQRHHGSVLDASVPWDACMIHRCYFNKVNYGILAFTGNEGVDTYTLKGIDIVDCRFGEFYKKYAVDIGSTVFNAVDSLRFIDFSFDGGRDRDSVRKSNPDFTYPINALHDATDTFEVYSKHWLHAPMNPGFHPTSPHTRVVFSGDGVGGIGGIREKVYTAYGSTIKGSRDPNTVVSTLGLQLMYGCKLGDEYTDIANGKKYTCTTAGTEMANGVWTEAGSVPADADGGYYTPSVSHDGSGAMTISFAPSKSAMPAVAPVMVQLPAGQKGDQGNIGPAGPGYILSDTDKSEIADMMENATVIQPPKHVDSVEEMTDTDRAYVLISTGHIWAYANTTITKQEPVTTVITGSAENGFIDGSRLSSSGTEDTFNSAADDAVYHLTPKIDLTKAEYRNKAITIKLEGAQYAFNDSLVANIQCRLYDVDGNPLVNRLYTSPIATADGYLLNKTKGFTVEHDDEKSVTTVTVTFSSSPLAPSYGNSDPKKVGYIRFCGCHDTLGNTMADAKVSITYYEEKTETGYQWYDTGETYAPKLSAEEKREIALEAAAMIDLQMLDIIGHGEVIV